MKQTIHLGSFTPSLSYCDAKQTCAATLPTEKRGNDMRLNPLEPKFWVSLEGRMQKPEGCYLRRRAMRLDSGGRRW